MNAIYVTTSKNDFIPSSSTLSHLENNTLNNKKNLAFQFFLLIGIWQAVDSTLKEPIE